MRITNLLIILIILSCSKTPTHEAFLYVTDTTTVPRGIVGLEVNDYEGLSKVEKIEWVADEGDFKKSESPKFNTALWIAPEKEGIYKIKCKVTYNDGGNVEARFREGNGADVEVSDTAEGKFKYLGHMRDAREGGAIVQLDNDRIFIAGGLKEIVQKEEVFPDGSKLTHTEYVYHKTSEIFFLSLGTSIPFLEFDKDIFFKGIYLLSSNKILIPDGILRGFWDPPWTNDIIKIIDLNDKSSTEVLLPYHLKIRGTVFTENGKLIMVMEDIDADDSEYIYVFDVKTFILTNAGALKRYRNISFTMEKMKDGRVIIAGGDNTDGASTAEIFDPQDESFRIVGETNLEYENLYGLINRLKSGKILLTGFSKSEIYDPVNETFTLTGSIGISNWQYIIGKTLSGEVMIIGGSECSGKQVLMYVE